MSLKPQTTSNLDFQHKNMANSRNVELYGGAMSVELLTNFADVRYA